MAVITIALLLSAVCTVTLSQRPFYAGLRPIGYPAVPDAPAQNVLSNRFGDDEPIPLEARGDRDLVYRIQQLPEDSRPFWYLNQKQYDNLRRNSQNWPLRPSVFLP